MGWNSIKTALYTMVDNMTVENGYNYDWNLFFNADIAQIDGVYLQIKTLGEENTDADNYTSTDEYRQRRLVSFYVHLDNPVGITDFDQVQELCETKLELAKQDILKQYNSCYNSAGDAGANKLMYQGFEIIIDENADIYAPVKMGMEYIVEYIESRNV